MPAATIRPPAARAALTAAAVPVGTTNCSGYGASPPSSDDTPVWSSRGEIPTPARTSRVTSRSVKGRLADGISALPGVRPKTVWYASIGQFAVHVPVPDRSAVAAEEPQRGVDPVEARDPEPPAVGERGQQLRRGAPGQRHRLGRREPPWCGRAAAGGANLHERDTTGERPRVVHDHGCAVGEPAVEGRGDRGGGVHHEQVVGPEEPGEVGERRRDRIAVALADEQAHLVARRPACLGRLTGLVRSVQRERERRRGEHRAHRAPASDGTARAS